MSTISVVIIIANPFLSRIFFGKFQYERGIFDVKTLQRGWEIGREESLRFVYQGNVPWSDGENAYCYTRRELVIGPVRRHNR